MKKLLLLPLLITTLLTSAQKNKPVETFPFDTAITNQLKFREIGPWRGGRSTAVAGDPSDNQVFYFGATGGGVWKSRDAGAHWTNISDGFFGGSVGSIAVSQSDPSVIYVGMGENSMRGNVSEGFGMWKSTNGGRSWQFMGLGDTRHIMKIAIHPKNPDIVYCAAQGHLFGPNTERGVFKSVDGGRSWQKILYVDENTGACDLVMDPGDPEILLAGFWRVRRTPYALESGGPGSGIYKTTNGGAQWENISRNKGLPKDTVGIVGLTISASDPKVYYAIIESKTGGLFRSDDAGKTWVKTSDDANIRQRAWYYSKIFCDPAQENTVYVLNVEFWKSVDGGKTFKSISTPHGDHHDLWIDPKDPERMIIADDGGAQVSTNGGDAWSTYYNQPTAQIYRVSVDNAVPYRLLGAQQDNSSLRIRHRSKDGQIDRNDWEPTAGFESGFIAADPLDPDIVYGGNYSGYIGCINHKTGDERNITVWPDDPIGQGADKQKYRFQWNFPIFFSPHNPKRLYAAGNVLFYTEDAGTTWHAMSPDLTTNDKSKQQPSGGIITKDNTGVEVYCTIFAAAESPLEKGVVYAGSDDGLLHVTKDDGKTWQNITPKDLPPFTLINSIEVDPLKKGRMYFAGTRYKMDDFTPYLYMTEDYGATWQKITNGISPQHFTRVIRADQKREGLLYCGTEYGLYISYNSGKQWHAFQNNLPLVPITDMTFKNNDLVIATQGRGFWIMDDITPLQQMSGPTMSGAMHVYPVRDTYRIGGWQNAEPQLAGKNPTPGVEFRLWIPLLKNKKGEDSIPALRVEIRDADNALVKTFSTSPKDTDTKLELNHGLNTFNWDMRYPGGKKIEGMFLWNGVPGGPMAAPGNYTTQWFAGTELQPFHTAAWQIKQDPNSAAVLDDYLLQHDFLMDVLDLFNTTQTAIASMQSLQKQMDGYIQKLDSLAPASLKDSVTAIKSDLDTIINELYETRNKSDQDMLNYGIKLNDKLAGVYNAASAGNFRPSKNQIEVYTILEAQIKTQLAAFETIKSERVVALNKQIDMLDLPVIIAK